MIGPAMISETPSGIREVYFAGDVMYCWYVPGKHISHTSEPCVIEYQKLGSGLTCCNQAGVDSLLAVILTTVPALFTVVAHIPQRLDSTAVADLPVLDVLANLYNDTGAFVASTFAVELGHGWDRPVVHHEMNVAHTEARGVKPEEDIIRAYKKLGYQQMATFATASRVWERLTGLRHINHLDLDLEIRSLIDDHTCLALLWDVCFLRHLGWSIWCMNVAGKCAEK